MHTHITLNNTYKYTHICVECTPYTCICTHVYIYIYIYIYIRAYMHTHKITYTYTHMQYTHILISYINKVVKEITLYC